MNVSSNQKRALVAGLLALAVVAGALVHAHEGRTGGGDQASGPGRSVGRTVRRFVAAQLYRIPPSFSQTNAVTLAQSIDMLSENQGELDRWFPAMRAANPSLVILKYVSGSTSHASELLPPSEYLHGTDGSLCVQAQFRNVVMNVRDPGWIASRIAGARSPGFDGVFLDVMGAAPVAPGYLSCIPVDPATAQRYTPADWLRDTTAEAGIIKRALGSALVISNGLDNGSGFFDPRAPTSLLLSTSDGALAEGWMRDKSRPAATFPTIGSWMDDWRMLTGDGARVVIGMVKMGSGTTPAQIDQWHRFSLATFLLGASAGSYYDFIGGDDLAANLADSPSEHVDLGPALGPATQQGDAWVRRYLKGMVVVNPTAAPVAVPLPRPARDLAGQSVATSDLLPAHSGDVLVDD